MANDSVSSLPVKGRVYCGLQRHPNGNGCGVRGNR
jgi:hypothetical protein